MKKISKRSMVMLVLASLLLLSWFVVWPAYIRSACADVAVKLINDGYDVDEGTHIYYLCLHKKGIHE
jgi:hypothetical protein